MIFMEFLDKLTKKASETYKGAAEKTGKLAKEAKLKMKISDNKSKMNDFSTLFNRKRECGFKYSPKKYHKKDSNRRN